MDLNPSAARSLQLYAQRDRHAAAAKERVLQIEFVQATQQAQVLRALRPRLVVVGRARQSQQLALPLHTQIEMSRIDP